MIIKTGFITKKIKLLCYKMFNKIENNNDPDIDRNGEKVFIGNLMEYFRNKKEAFEFFDVGCNVGDYTDLLIRNAIYLKYRIHCFEPTKYCLNKLNDRFKEFPEVNIYNFGLSDNECETKIFYDKEGSGLASLYERNLKSYGLELDKFEKIKLKRADAFLIANDIDHIDFLKLDIEGNELKALNGFGKYLNGEFIDFIQFEYGGANLDSKSSLLDIYSLLQSRGFFVAKIMKNGLEIREYEPYMENYMYSNYVAISERIIKKIK